MLLLESIKIKYTTRKWSFCRIKVLICDCICLSTITEATAAKLAPRATFGKFLNFRAQKGPKKINFLSFKTHKNLFCRHNFSKFFMSPNIIDSSHCACVVGI